MAGMDTRGQVLGGAVVILLLSGLAKGQEKPEAAKPAMSHGANAAENQAQADAPSTVVLLCPTVRLLETVRAELPDTPEAKQGANVPGQKQGKIAGQGPLRIIARRSFFYPELATSPGPLSAKEKFELFLTESISPPRILSAAADAGISQARDSLSGYGQGSAGYGLRFGSSMATGASSHFFGTFLLPSMLKQDPRYFVRGTGSFAQRVGYALRRTVLTRSDSGKEVFNWSGLLGPLAGEGLANTYLPAAEQTSGKTFQRYGIRVGFGAANNLLKEYWPTIFKNLGMRKIAPGLGPDPATPGSPPKPP